jgi:hypothetical protein
VTVVVVGCLVGASGRARGALLLLLECVPRKLLEQYSKEPEGELQLGYHHANQT